MTSLGKPFLAFLGRNLLFRYGSEGKLLVPAPMNKSLRHIQVKAVSWDMSGTYTGKSSQLGHERHSFISPRAYFKNVLTAMLVGG